MMSIQRPQSACSLAPNSLLCKTNERFPPGEFYSKDFLKEGAALWLKWLKAWWKKVLTSVKSIYHVPATCDLH